jgi:hypothetical protein
MTRFSSHILALAALLLCVSCAESGGDPCEYRLSAADCEAPVPESGDGQGLARFGRQMQGMGEIRNGRLEGFWQFADDAGNRLREGHFEGGRATGFWKWYYPSGNLREEGQIRDCQPEGFYKFYHENGQVASEGSFEGGKRRGVWQYYDAQGRSTGQRSYDCP